MIRTGCLGQPVLVGAHVLLVDSITEAIGRGDRVVVSGSHGGLSAGRFALESGARVVVFNDAGIGRDRAGVAALDLLQAHGVAAAAVSHDSARIGEARSTFEDGIVSCANDAATALGAAPGLRVRDWLAHVEA